MDDPLIPRASRSLVWRWLAGTLLVGLAGLGVLFMVVDRTTAASSRQIVEQAVATDLAGLVDIYVTSGEAELTARIGDRLAMPSAEGDARHYLLSTGDGRKLAGDLERWPQISAETSEMAIITPQGPGIGGPVLAQATMLEPGVRLVVGHEFAAQTAMRRDIRTGFALAAAALLAALLLWAFLAARALRTRVDRVNTLFRAIGDGASAPDLPVTGPPDELGELTAHALALKHRIGALLASQRQVNDHLAHEIRTPLVHLDNRLAALADGPENASAEALNAARENIRDLVQLLEGLLDIAVTEARSGERIGLVPVDLSETTASIAELFADSAEDMGVCFTSDIVPGVTLAGDRPMLQRLVSNLLDNALKFTPSGGEVHLSLREGPELRVSDTGPGVPDDWKTRIFQRFERAESDTNGHGLGLALSQAIARRHGLTIHVLDNNPGAVFVVGKGDRRDA
ncbi:sensor histidine kinase [Qipengyuania sp. DSG2-2]|uniref:sensor histidine kinase n=1 Tax=Qipengyuania sp. DGS2-2 TaxID=3349631 RepID=UPI0036D20B9E